MAAPQKKAGKAAASSGLAANLAKPRAVQKPSREEMDRNPRAYSARLRVIEKVGC